MLLSQLPLALKLSSNFKLWTTAQLLHTIWGLQIKLILVYFTCGNANSNLEYLCRACCKLWKARGTLCSLLFLSIQTTQSMCHIYPMFLHTFTPLYYKSELATGIIMIKK